MGMFSDLGEAGFHTKGSSLDLDLDISFHVCSAKVYTEDGFQKYNGRGIGLGEVIPERHLEYLLLFRCVFSCNAYTSRNSKEYSSILNAPDACSQRRHFLQPSSTSWRISTDRSRRKQRGPSAVPPPPVPFSPLPPEHVDRRRQRRRSAGGGACARVGPRYGLSVSDLGPLCLWPLDRDLPVCLSPSSPSLLPSLSLNLSVCLLLFLSIHNSVPLSLSRA